MAFPLVGIQLVVQELLVADLLLPSRGASTHARHLREASRFEAQGALGSLVEPEQIVTFIFRRCSLLATDLDQLFFLPLLFVQLILLSFVCCNDGVLVFFWLCHYLLLFIIVRVYVDDQVLLVASLASLSRDELLLNLRLLLGLLLPVHLLLQLKLLLILLLNLQRRFVIITA